MAIYRLVKPLEYMHINTWNYNLIFAKSLRNVDVSKLKWLSPREKRRCQRQTLMQQRLILFSVNEITKGYSIMYILPLKNLTLLSGLRWQKKQCLLGTIVRCTYISSLSWLIWFTASLGVIIDAVYRLPKNVRVFNEYIFRWCSKYSVRTVSLDLLAIIESVPRNKL